MGVSNFREVGGRCAIKKFSVLWKSMIHPLLTMTVYGVIWYQGESNAGEKSSNYSCTLPAMISGWRENWHKHSLNTTISQLPFGFAQVGKVSFFSDQIYIRVDLELPRPLLSPSSKN